MLTRKSVVLAKIEETYGTDPVPTVSANAILVNDVDIKPTGEAVERNHLRSTLSPLEFVRGIKSVEVSFKTELKGTGTRGALPAFGWEGVLFRACGMSEVVTEETSIVYQPVSTGIESCTLYVYKDGICHKVSGCRGTFKLTGEVGKYMVVEWTFNGLYVSPVDLAPGAQTFSAVKPPLVLGGSFTIGAYAAVLTKVEIDIGNTVSQRKSINEANGIASFEITARSPQGSIDPEVVAEETYAFWQKWEEAAAAALNLGPLGAVSGNIVTIAAPKVQHKDQTYSDRDGMLAYSIPFALAGNAGDDELVITIT